MGRSNDTPDADGGFAAPHCSDRPTVTRFDDEPPVANPCGLVMVAQKLHGRIACWKCGHCGWSYGDLKQEPSDTSSL